MVLSYFITPPLQMHRAIFVPYYLFAESFALPEDLWK